MKIETEFNKGDIAWGMRDNCPVEVVVTEIKIEVKSNEPFIEYKTEWRGTQKIGFYIEGRLFPTKEALLKSL